MGCYKLFPAARILVAVVVLTQVIPSVVPRLVRISCSIVGVYVGACCVGLTTVLSYPAEVPFGTGTEILVMLRHWHAT